MAETAISPDSSQRRSGLERGVDKVWRFFTSVRNAIYEISFLTLLVLIGTLRGSSVPRQLADALPFTEGLVDRWYAWDVFRSGLFAATLAVIAIAIIICTLNRVPQIWLTIAHPKITTSMGFINGAETAATYQLETSADTAFNQLQETLTKRRYRVLTEKVGEATHVYADKNRFANFGTFPFHLGLILLLVGGIVASTFGFREQEFIVAENTRENVGHGTGLSVELHKVTDVWSELGTPIKYESIVTIYQDGKPVKDGSIRVNHPLTYGSATFYQSSLGYTAEFTVRNASGDIVFSGPIELGTYTARSNPDAPAGFIDLAMDGIRLSVISRDKDDANQPELDTLRLSPGQIWVGMPGDTTGVVLEQGQPAKVGDYTVTFEREGNFSVLQVGYNPGIPIFIIAAFFMVGGLMVTFYFPHRRIRAILTPGESGTTLAMAPLAKRDYSGKREFFGILGRLNDVWSTKPTVRAPKNATDYEYLYINAPSSEESQ